MVVELKGANNDTDSVYVGDVGDIETARNDDDRDAYTTAVYVLTVEDDSDDTPLAELVLVIVPNESASTEEEEADGTVDVALELDSRTLSMSVSNYEVDGEDADSWNGSDLTVTVTQTVNGTPYVFEDSVEGSFTGLAATVNGLIEDALTVTNVGSGNTIEVEVVVSFTGGSGVDRSFSGSDIIIT